MVAYQVRPYAPAEMERIIEQLCVLVGLDVGRAGDDPERAERMRQAFGYIVEAARARQALFDLHTIETQHNDRRPRRRTSSASPTHSIPTAGSRGRRADLPQGNFETTGRDPTRTLTRELRDGRREPTIRRAKAGNAKASHRQSPDTPSNGARSRGWLCGRAQEHGLTLIRPLPTLDSSTTDGRQTASPREVPSFEVKDRRSSVSGRRSGCYCQWSLKSEGALDRGRSRDSDGHTRARGALAARL
jgi:hypothetical protein